MAPGRPQRPIAIQCPVVHAYIYREHVDHGALAPRAGRGRAGGAARARAEAGGRRLPLSNVTNINVLLSLVRSSIAFD